VDHPGSTEPSSAGTNELSDKHALLVGVTNYLNPDVPKLKGPGHDVELMRLLLKNYGFAERAITVLKASDDPKSKRPTRQNILQELEALAGQVKRGDKVVVYLSGHGSRAPRQPKPGDSNPEALTGLFLPQDIGTWSSSVKKVENAIEDWELGARCQAILERGAFLWLIVDSCHSGGIVSDQGRAIDDVSRDVPAKVLQIPKKLLAQAVAAERARPRNPADEQSRSAEDLNPALHTAINHPRFAAVYACRALEQTWEKKFPIGSPREGPYGIFTYALVSTLNQASGKLTYAELVRRINVQYDAWGRAGRPVALAAGKARDLFVLDDQSGRRSHIRLLRTADNQLQINAGRLHGLNRGSILAVYPPPGQRDADRPVGHVRVRYPEIFSAVVVPCPSPDGKMPSPSADALQAETRCRPVYYDFDIEPLRLGITEGAAQRRGGTDRKCREEEKARLRADLRQLGADTKLFTVVEDGRQQPEWQLVLTPSAEGAPTVSLRSTESGMAFSPQRGQDRNEWLHDSLRKIARGKNLLKIAGAAQDAPLGQKLEVELVLSIYRSAGDTRPRVVDSQHNGIALFDGDIITFELVNRSKEAVDMSLLFLGSDYTLKELYPHPSQIGANRVGPKQSRRTHPFEINNTSAGTERVLLIALSATTPTPMDFGFLEEEGIRGARQRGEGTLSTPLGKLLLSSLFPEDSAKELGVGDLDLATFTVRPMKWQMEKGKRRPAP
jgi:hypothetical protein